MQKKNFRYLNYFLQYGGLKTETKLGKDEKSYVKS